MQRLKHGIVRVHLADSSVDAFSYPFDRDIQRVAGDAQLSGNGLGRLTAHPSLVNGLHAEAVRPGLAPTGELSPSPLLTGAL